mmetsp:Transcript_3273/g.9333  ORF Transcript_3273/g.9333 Transcript_3273/m.9333 type:complete len:185 (-) Transcript_3273:1087-1641(-)
MIPMSRRKGLQVSMPPAFATADSMATLSAVSALQELSCSPHRIHMPANFVDCIMSENNCPLQLQAAGSGHHGGISTESISSDCSTAVSFPLSSSLSPASSGASPRALQAMYRPTLISGKGYSHEQAHAQQSSPSFVLDDPQPSPRKSSKTTKGMRRPTLEDNQAAAADSASNKVDGNEVHELME